MIVNAKTGTRWQHGIWRPVVTCEAGQVCQRPMVNHSYKVLFALVTLLLVAALVFPLFAHWFY